MTETELAAAFTEWMRRYNEEPERFGAEWEQAKERYVSVAGSSEPVTYGPSAAAYLLSILAEQA